MPELITTTIPTAELIALRNDKARLDWLEANKGAVEYDDTIEFSWGINTDSGQESGETLREAIDAGRAAKS